jgi:hypothetical protein
MVKAEPKIKRAQIAVSVFLSFLAFIALAAHPNDLARSALIWLVYVVVAGGVIVVNPGESLSRVARYAVAPTLSFLLTASFLTWLGLYAETTGLCASCGSTPLDSVQLRKDILIYLAITPPTFVGILLGSYARTALLNLYIKSRRVTVTELRALQKKIAIVLSIAGLLAGYLLAAHR